ncbi:MAG: hypothetical protein HQL68_13300 [Magnetococcales bacterium]|nr:hypothetical protein [Magnetococcales bacterium]
MRKAGLGALLEFTRAIHSEMDALTSAARKGISVRGAIMFVTAFPCHYCARHIVAAGIDEVQYIEPYPKSRALSLHGDSITDKNDNWLPPSSLHEPKNDSVNNTLYEVDVSHSTVGDPKFGLDTNLNKVLFRPFVGVAPRLYQRAFSKDRELKNKVTGMLDIGIPEWSGNWGIRVIPYPDLEAFLTNDKKE